MITLFRRIRQKLIASGSLTKYLLYAIGEILLVVIGILIALQVSNWNEERKAAQEVQNYLINLQDALNDDIRSLIASKSFNTLRLNGIFYLLEHAELDTSRFTDIPWAEVTNNDAVNESWKESFPDTLNKDYTTLVFSTLGRGFGITSFNRSVVNELYSTGSFSNIKNRELKQKIGDYYRYIEQRFEGYSIQEHEEWANETTRFLRDEYGIFTLDVSGLENPIAIIKARQDVEHYLRYLALEVNYHIIWGNQAIEMAEEIIHLIYNEQ